MTKSCYARMILMCFVLAACTLAGQEPAASEAPAQTEKETAENPFESALTQMLSRRQTPAAATSDSEDVIQESPPLCVQTVVLKFLRARNLKMALDKMSSAFGAIAVDDATNSLIICDTNETLEAILTEVRKADQTPKQIMIEVVIIDVLLSDDTEIGVDWDILSTEFKDASYRQGMIYPNRLLSTQETAETLGDASAFMTRGLGGEFAVVVDDIRTVVNLLQDIRETEILASPKVLVVSGQQAEIKTVEEIPYQERTETSGGGLLTSTQFKQIGVSLQVKATLTDDSKILMEIKPKQSVNTGVSISDVPVVDTREASTTLLVDDGRVVIVGGLRRKETKHTRFQVHILGDIPIIGILFSDDRQIVENSELLVLLSPHIYKDEPAPDDAMARFNEITQRPLLSIPRNDKQSSSRHSEK